MQIIQFFSETRRNRHWIQLSPWHCSFEALQIFKWTMLILALQCQTLIFTTQVPEASENSKSNLRELETQMSTCCLVIFGRWLWVMFQEVKHSDFFAWRSCAWIYSFLTTDFGTISEEASEGHPNICGHDTRANPSKLGTIQNTFICWFRVHA